MALACVMCCAGPVRAQQSVTIEFDGGQVTLRAILAEWARLGGATIVNGDRVNGPPVTLELTGVPERQALDVVLRDVAGYMLAPRRGWATGASSFDRILVLPTSVAPKDPPPQAAASTPRRRAPRFPVVRQPLIPNVRADEVDEPSDVQEPEGDGPAVTPGPGTRVMPERPFRPRLPAGSEPFNPNQDQNEPEAPADGGAAPTTANPFGVPFGSSSTPGVVTPVPPPQQPAGRQRQQGQGP